ncbi:low-affinity hexose transporter HXT3 [Fusarium circinatum]|uniref:Low-affinity hexose transporter HXT3 n=1 Tax=Fusarium circinatum TaxID=48490 RepID=A0A8H5T8K3_FUSCI|nr:low-affinity hexose transporter HXT3 [Fusarium circinatum]
MYHRSGDHTPTFFTHLAPRTAFRITPGFSSLTPFADAGTSYAFGYVFAGMNLAGTVIFCFFLYESKTLSLEVIDMMYCLPYLKARESAKWTPPGYVNREKKDQFYFEEMATGKDAEKVVVHIDSGVE